MPLANDFHDFLSPPDLSDDDTWCSLTLHHHAAYQRRFFIHGFRAAAQALGFRNVTALWDALGHLGVADGATGTSRHGPALHAVLAAVPPPWKTDLPDINDRGDAKPHTTYWREFSSAQLVNAWESAAQSLPKALLSVAALHRAAARQGADWDDLAKTHPVRIRPSVFWLVDFTAAIHDRHIANDTAITRDAYKACGLAFDLGPNKQSGALRQAAMGDATLTFDTPWRLCAWLALRDVACGPVLVAPEAYKLPAASEVFVSR